MPEKNEMFVVIPVFEGYQMSAENPNLRLRHSVDFFVGSAIDFGFICGVSRSVGVVFSLGVDSVESSVELVFPLSVSVGNSVDLVFPDSGSVESSVGLVFPVSGSVGSSVDLVFSDSCSVGS